MADRPFRTDGRHAHDVGMQSDPVRPVHLRVVVIDADERVRASLTGLLGIDDRLEVVGSAGRTESALELVSATGPDIVIVDPRLPDVNAGHDLIRRLRAMSSALRVLVMCYGDASKYADLSDSCDGYVRKTFRPADLIAAIFAVSAPAPG